MFLPSGETNTTRNKHASLYQAWERKEKGFHEKQRQEAQLPKSKLGRVRFIFPVLLFYRLLCTRSFLRPQGLADEVLFFCDVDKKHGILCDDHLL